jgi:purine-binding chemotaxis protein CheW
LTLEFMREFASDLTQNDARQLVTIFIDEQMFGLPILQVRDVFMVNDLTPVPLAPRAVAGLYNLRGRVLTMLSLRAMLDEGAAASGNDLTAIGIEWRGESFGLLVDRVGEVMSLSADSREANPANLDQRWASLSAGVHRLSDTLLVEISLDALFGSKLQDAA